MYWKRKIWQYIKRFLFKIFNDFFILLLFFFTLFNKKRFKPGNNAVFVKGYGDIPDVSKEYVFKAIYDYSVRIQWDKILENFHIVEKEG